MRQQEQRIKQIVSESAERLRKKLPFKPAAAATKTPETILEESDEELNTDVPSAIETDRMDVEEGHKLMDEPKPVAENADTSMDKIIAPEQVDVDIQEDSAIATEPTAASLSAAENLFARDQVAEAENEPPATVAEPLKPPKAAAKNEVKSKLPTLLPKMKHAGVPTSQVNQKVQTVLQRRQEEEERRTEELRKREEEKQKKAQQIIESKKKASAPHLRLHDHSL